MNLLFAVLETAIESEMRDFQRTADKSGSGKPLLHDSLLTEHKNNEIKDNIWETS